MYLPMAGSTAASQDRRSKSEAVSSRTFAVCCESFKIKVLGCQSSKRRYLEEGGGGDGERSLTWYAFEALAVKGA